MNLINKTKRRLVLLSLLITVLVLPVQNGNAEDEFKVCLTGVGFKFGEINFSKIQLADHFWNGHPTLEQYAVPYRMHMELTFNDGNMLDALGDAVALPLEDPFVFGVYALDPDGGQLTFTDDTEIKTGAGIFGPAIFSEDGFASSDSDGVFFLQGFQFDNVTLSGGQEFAFTPCP